MGNEKQSKQLVKWRKIKVSMAPHSSTLAWKIPWMEEPGRLQSMGSPRVGEAEDIKKRWQEYTEKLYKKDLHDPDNLMV